MHYLPKVKKTTKENNAQVNNAKDLDIDMEKYNLIEYSDNYSKTSRSLQQYYRDELKINLSYSESFIFKPKFLDNTNNADIINTKVAEQLK